MNIFSTNHLKKITKASLALVLAGSFTVSTAAFAAETTTETTQTYETVDLQELQSELENSQAETPSVVPGDFFYFAKIALEKITLAFTFDDAKEAELMATYASERLAEAAALFGEGKEAEALEVIQTAIEYMESSQAIIDDVSGSDEAVADDADSKTDVTDEAVTDETTTDEAVSEDGNTNEDATVVDEENDGEQGDLDEVEGTLRHNIIALTKAMEHVGNDQARASLQKNIDKTYAKIAKKLAKLEKKYGKTETEDENNAVTEENTNTEEVVTPAPDVEATPESSESVPATTGTETINPTVTAPQATESVKISNSQAPQTKGYEKKQEKQAEKAQPERGNSAQAHQNKPEQKGNKNQ